MSSWTGIPELKEGYRTLGPAKFWIMMGCIVGWCCLGAWLMMTTPGWPEAYGSTCHGRGCFITDLWHSPGLLHGGWHELSLFAFLWSMPALVVGALIYAFIKKRGIFAQSESE